MGCALADAYVVVGFASLPVGGERDFLKQEIELLLDSFLKRQLESVRCASEGSDTQWIQAYEKHLRSPVHFFSFGRFDLMWIAVLDDLELPVGAYRPFDPIPGLRDGRSKAETFAHQVTVCPLPRFAGEEDAPDGTEWLKPASAFLNQVTEAPAVGFCQIKTNHLLGAAAGTSYLRTLVRSLRHAGTLDLKTGKPLPQDKKCDVLVLESYAWHELSLLVKSDSLEAIGRTVERISSLSLGDLQSFAGFDENKKIDGELDTDGSLFSRVLFACQDFNDRMGALGLELQDGEGALRCPTQQDLLERHLFLSTTTCLGVHFPVVEDRNLDTLSQSDSISWSTRWFLEAGHHDEVHQALSVSGKVMSGPREPRTILGRGDLWFPIYDRGTSGDLVECVYRSNRAALRNAFGVSAGYTTVGARAGVGETKTASIADYHEAFRPAVTIHQQRIERLHGLMVNNGFCKVTSKRILTMISVFNDGIHDNMMFPTFSELHPFVDWVLFELETRLNASSDDKAQPRLTTLVKRTNHQVDQFEHAFRNRYRSSHRLGDISEVNLDFRGGVQQLVSALHCTINALGRAIGVAPGLVWIGGDAGASSSTHCVSIHLNPFHAFQLEHFASVVGHEIAHSWMATPLGTHYSKLRGEEVDRLEGDRQLLTLVKGKLATKRREHFALFKDKAAERLNWKSEALEAALEVPHERQDSILEEIVCDAVGYWFSYGGDVRLASFWLPYHFLQQGPDFALRSEVERQVLLTQWCFRWFSAVRLAAPASADGFAERIKDIVSDKLNERLFPARSRGAVVIAMKMTDALMESTVAPVLARLVHHAGEIYRGVLSLGSTKPLVVPEHQTGKADAAISSGSVFEYLPISGQDLTYAAFVHVHAVMLSYLRAIARSNKWRLVSLVRDENGDPDQACIREAGPFLVDPRGGTFVANAKARRKYAMLRSSAVMSLWDVSAREMAERWLRLSELTVA